MAPGSRDFRLFVAVGNAELRACYLLELMMILMQLTYNWPRVLTSRHAHTSARERLGVCGGPTTSPLKLAVCLTKSEEFRKARPEMTSS